MKCFQEAAREMVKALGWILDQAARPREFPRDVDERDRSRDPNRAASRAIHTRGWRKPALWKMISIQQKK